MEIKQGGESAPFESCSKTSLFPSDTQGSFSQPPLDKIVQPSNAYYLCQHLACGSPSYTIYKYIIDEERIGSFTPLSNHWTNTYWASNAWLELRSKGRNSAKGWVETVQEGMKGHVCSEKDKTGLTGSSHTGQQQEKSLDVQGNQRPACRVGMYFFQQHKAMTML